LTPSLLERLTILVADDEAPARQRILDLLRHQPATLLEASDGITAVAMVEQHQPDLFFLDVQMPELDGLGVIDAIGPAAMPLTIFVTAYDQHAIRAFEANALDYLLKPFSDERFEATMARVHARLHERSMADRERSILDLETRMRSLLSTLPSLDRPHEGKGTRRIDRFVIKSGGTTRFIRATEIDWIEAAGVYVNLHVAGKQLLYRAPLNDLVEKLDPQRFIRVHRSAIINIDSITQLQPISHGEFEVLLKDGSRPRVSRTYRSELEKRLGQPL
jgi:two-component system LytT family response regulator